MKWLEFLSETLEEKQIEVLRFALKKGASIYFYGSGWGKSTLVYTLSELGYSVSAAGEPYYEYGSIFVPDGTDFISFNLKRNPRDKYIAGLWETFITEQKEDILEWINL